MRKILLLLTLIASLDCFSQTTIIQRDPEIEKMVKEIKAENLEQYVRKLAEFGTRHTLSDQQVNRGILASQNYVLAHFKSMESKSTGRLSSEIDFFTIPADNRRIPTDSKLGNVIATLKGTDPNDDRVFLIMAHIDSRALDVMNNKIDAPGANDDGSGVAAIMELASIMSSRSFPATIKFAVVSGEEQGLKGAEYLAKKAKEENWNLVAVLNNDMIGNSRSSETEIADNTRIRIFSEGVPMAESEQMAAIRRYTNGENDSKSRQLARFIKEIGEKYVDQLEVKLVYRNDRFLRGGDHTPFAREGFTAIRVCEMNENYYAQHEDVRLEDGIQYGDLPEFMDFEYMRKATGINLAVLANLATAPSEPLMVGIDVRKLSNTSTLRWDAPKTGKARGYYVLLRETDASMWQKKFYTEDLTMTIPYSKDNYFFAVQAVGENGHESLAVFPQPITR
ncbi:M20/M25/M40 family metallo-hydrolase [Belliella kenyensis]|uniref:M20/M25/M40 family metallo-hydrolase n=1 Tax=Belliella kenyensis TaxID=1472724 RepID=A0ABV8EJR8_9BACT|nr:M20/M25/M40 family metallo-hydrolase [Belliella kenyensis]MCH7403223.1 M20/M25/M40 family metallo-hydrolase [Belliella kenyensis]MDN3604834.1 M20/M25/M40 family metallo-hydrolase [Belliella kenyensis]